MFRRLLFHLLSGNRVRLAVALVALISGGAVISALMNLDLDIHRKLAAEFRSLGANLIVSAPQTSAAANSQTLIREDSLVKIRNAVPTAEAAPYLYLVGQIGDPTRDVVIAGTQLEQARQISPWWKITASADFSSDDSTQCWIGRTVSRSLGLQRGQKITLDYHGHTAKLEVAGIIDAGGPEDNQIFVSLPVAQQLAGVPGEIELVQVSAAGSTAQIRAGQAQLEAALPGLDVKPIPQIATAEGALLGRIRFLIFSAGLLILVLTALCIWATTAALAMERRHDVGLMKALGGSMQKVLRLFLTEVGVLGVAGGVFGYALGMALSVWMGHRVFGTSIAPRWEILPVTVALMVVVTLAGAIPLRLLGNVRPAVILRGE